MEIERLDGPFGTEVVGLDLTDDPDAATLEAVKRAFVESHVLCFRAQRFEAPGDFLAAARLLGEPLTSVTATYRLPGLEAIDELTNTATDKRTGDTAPLRRGGSWHTDHSNLECPPKATMLYAIALPRTGGNTEFTSLQMAHDALPDDLRSMVRGRRAFHAYLSRRAPRKLLTRTKAEEEGSSGCWQPLVRRHPETGRDGLYFNPMRCDDVEGYDQAAGDALLDRLYAHADQPRFQYSHRWRLGDVLMWDNRAVLHQATFDFDPAERRYLHRILLKGDEPISAV